MRRRSPAVEIRDKVLSTAVRRPRSAIVAGAQTSSGLADNGANVGELMSEFNADINRSEL